jgi:hypothetical protein
MLTYAGRGHRGFAGAHLSPPLLEEQPALHDGRAGTHFSCFTSTKVQILTQEALQLKTDAIQGVRLLTGLPEMLYEHKSTDTDAEGAAAQD